MRVYCKPSKMHKCVWGFLLCFSGKSSKTDSDKYHTYGLCCMWSKSQAKQSSSHILSFSGLRENFYVNDENKFFTVRATEYCQRLSREVADSAS